MMSTQINNSILESLIIKFCHDLINPLGTAQMAMENNDNESLKIAIENAISKLDMFRFLYRSSIDSDIQYDKFKSFLNKTKLNFIINENFPDLSAFLFWLTQKMFSKSAVLIEKNQIRLTNFFFQKEELDILNEIPTEITPGNILIYLAYLKYKNNYKLEIIQLENNEWKLTIKTKNSSNLKE